MKFSLKSLIFFSEMPGGRPSSFSRLISGGNRSPELAEGNAEGAELPRR